MSSREEGNGGIIVQQEGVAGGRVVVHHQLLHAPQHLHRNSLTLYQGRIFAEALRTSAYFVLLHSMQLDMT